MIIASLAALGALSVFIGHSLAAGPPEKTGLLIARAIDYRPVSITPPRPHSERSVPQLELEPIAITERDGIQSLDISVTADRYDSPAQPITRYGISWYVRNTRDEIIVPDNPRLAAIAPDLAELQELVSMPLNFNPGYYELQVLLATNDDDDGAGWTAGGSLFFEIRDNDLLLVPPEDYIWESNFVSARNGTRGSNPN